MLSYRHSFHAGNHADVLKHSVQSLIIESLKEKNTPFIYLDTHAGAGLYQLTDPHATRTEEYRQGIDRVWQQTTLPPMLKPYISVIRQLNPNGQLRYYPGSPLIAAHLLRPQDKILLSELHPTDHARLRQACHTDTRIQIQQTDGYRQLKAQLPPSSRRGLILIDPSYELKSDYTAVIEGIREGYKRFSTGIFALWYPVVLRQEVKRLLNALTHTGIRKILQVELRVLADNTRHGMTASGMVIINPPWKLESQLQQLLPWLHHTLVPYGEGDFSLNWLVPE